MIRVAAPITNKNIVQPMREHINTEQSSLELSDVTRAVKTNSGSELLEQNNSNIDQSTAAEVFQEILKNPNVTVNFIKNIAELQENIDLIGKHHIELPENLVEEFEKLFSELSVRPENIASELMNQEQLLTSFKGELFDFLRELSKESPAPGVNSAITNLLKALNSEVNKPEILRTLTGSFNYLAENLSSDKNLAEQIYNLAEKFASPLAEKDFQGLKRQAEQLLSEIDKNPYSDSKMNNICKMIKYNLSKFSTNENSLEKAISKLMKYIPEEKNKANFMQKLYNCLSGFENKNINYKADVFNSIVKTFQNLKNNENILKSGDNNVENNLNSLFSSQSSNAAKGIEQVLKQFEAKSENTINELIGNEQKNSSEIQNNSNSDLLESSDIVSKDNSIDKSQTLNSENNSQQNQIDNSSTPNQTENIKSEKDLVQNQSENVKVEDDLVQNQSENIKGENDLVQNQEENIKNVNNLVQNQNESLISDNVNVKNNLTQAQTENSKEVNDFKEQTPINIKDESNLNQEALKNIKQALSELLKNDSSPELKNAVKNLLMTVDIENNKAEILKKFSGSLSILEKENMEGQKVSSQLNTNSDKNILGNAVKEAVKFIPDEADKINFMQNVFETFSVSENTPESEIFDALFKIFQNQRGSGNEMELPQSFESLIKFTDENLKQSISELVSKSENLAEDFISSKNVSSVFKGEMFDDLRQLLKENPSLELKESVSEFLKTIAVQHEKTEILKNFTSELGELSKKIPDDIKNNLNENSLNEVLKDIIKFIPKDENKIQFLQKFYNFTSGAERAGGNSKVLDTLVKILQKQTGNESVMQMKGDSVESVLHSLLSSPSNFAPLLHFAIPIDDGILKAFGEMWINPDEEETKTNKKSKSSSEVSERTIHMLLVFEIPQVGKFETELWVKGKKINMSLLCPPSLEANKKELSADLRKSISFSEYSFEEIKVGKLEKNRSLAEVFPTLPQKRNGINVRI